MQWHKAAVEHFIGVNCSSGTRLLSAGWHSSTEEQGRQFTLHWCNTCMQSGSSALVLIGDCNTVYPAECTGVWWTFIGVNAVAQGCCQLLGTAAQKNKAGSLP